MTTTTEETPWARILTELASLHDDLAGTTAAIKRTIKLAEDAAERADARQQIATTTVELEDARRRLALLGSLHECLLCWLRIQSLLVPVAERPRSPSTEQEALLVPAGTPQEPTR